MITLTLTEDQAVAIIKATEIIIQDVYTDEDGDPENVWMLFDSNMCLDDLVEAKEKIKEEVKKNG